MWQGEKIRKMADELGVDYRSSSSEQEILKSIAEQVGLEDYNNLYDKDALEEKLGHYLNHRDEWNRYNQSHNMNNRKGSQFALPSKRNATLQGLPRKNDLQGLSRNKFNKARNLPFLNRKKKKQEADSDDSNNTSHNNVVDLNNEEEVSLKKSVKEVKTLFIVALVTFLFIFILFIVAAIITIAGGNSANLFSGIYGGLDQSMTDNPNEKKYYEKLDDVVNKYRKNCGISLNKNYIHALLIYPSDDYDELFSTSNFSTLTSNVDTVAKLMVNNCSVDYEVDGDSYERVKNSSFFKDYYKDLLDNSDADDILTSVFELASFGTEMFSNTWYINDNLKVVLKTCNTYDYLNGTKENSTVGFSEYIMGVLYGELDPNLEVVPENKEFLKAQVIAATSYVLSRANYQSGDTEIVISNGNCWQLSCNINEGCTYAYDLGTYGTCYSGIQDKNNTDWKRNPISESKLSFIKEIMEEVYGIVMINPDGSIKEPQYRNGSCGSDCMGQQPGMVDAQNGMTYEEILAKYYDNYTLNNVSEDLYADVTYEDGGYTSNVVYYNQNDYNNKFCGRSDGTIASSGCGVTSMSIVLSTLVDSTFTPPVVMEEAYGMGSCGRGISGTSSSFFSRSSKLHGLSHRAVNKRGDLQSVINSLNSGNSLVIAHMGYGTFTRGGHYIVLARVNNEGQVYVYDCNNPKKNGWYDFNSVIVKQLKGSLHIITKG